jgi:hypothetical protein
LVIKSLDPDPYGYWPKMLDRDTHLNKCLSKTLAIALVLGFLKHKVGILPPGLRMEAGMDNFDLR